MTSLQMETLEGFGLATVIARKGISSDAIYKALDIELTSAAVSPANTAGLSLIGTGPKTWLAYQSNRDGLWIEGLQEQLRGLASVSDQSGGYMILRLSGPFARVILQRGVSIDLNAEVFGPGSAASTLIAHTGVILWQLDGTPTYELAIFRSFFESFIHWLETVPAVR